MQNPQRERQPVHWFRKVLAFSLLFFCLWFIWSNSMLSPVESARRSRAVAEYLTRFLRIFAPNHSAIKAYLIRNVRKVAHAVEFFTLGSVCAIILLLLKWINAHMVLHAVLLLLAVAVTDETIQLFSRRGSQVSDILLDFSGGMAGLCAAFLILLITRAMFIRKPNK